MKKFIYVLLVALLLSACASYKTLNLNRLTTGMTKLEVEQVAGLPSRILGFNETKDGIQEILEYRTSRDEVYALEFWNDYLTGYEYLYDDYQYIPPVGPPAYYPDYGRPIVVIPGRPDRPNRPNRPNRPTQPNRPSPGQPNRPGGGGSTGRPTETRPTTRPTEGSRPVGTPSESSRPSVSRENNTNSNTNTNTEGTTNSRGRR